MKTFSHPGTQQGAPRSGKTRRWIILSAAIIILVMVISMVIGILAGTGENSRGLSYSSSRESDVNAPTVGASPTYAAGAPVAQSGSKASGGTSNSSTADGTGGSTYNIGNQMDRMIIRNATLSLSADNVDKTLADIRSLVVAQQGTVTTSNTTIQSGKTYASIVIQVPSQVYDQTMNQLRGLAKVENETSSSQDVTEEYVDTDAQIRNLKATEAQLLELMKKATNVNETLTVQRELSSVRGEIERRQGRLNFLQKKTDLSTITINIAPTGAVTPLTTSENWDFGKVLDQAWSGSLRGLQGLATVVVTFLVYAVWIVPLLALAVFLVVFAFRRTFRGRQPQQPGPGPSQGSGSTPPGPSNQSATA